MKNLIGVPKYSFEFFPNRFDGVDNRLKCFEVV